MTEQKNKFRERISSKINCDEKSIKAESIAKKSELAIRHQIILLKNEISISEFKVLEQEELLDDSIFSVDFSSSENYLVNIGKNRDKLVSLKKEVEKMKDSLLFFESII